MIDCRKKISTYVLGKQYLFYSYNNCYVCLLHSQHILSTYIKKWRSSCSFTLLLYQSRFLKNFSIFKTLSIPPSFYVFSKKKKYIFCQKIKQVILKSHISTWMTLCVYNLHGSFWSEEISRFVEMWIRQQSCKADFFPLNCANAAAAVVGKRANF